MSESITPQGDVSRRDVIKQALKIGGAVYVAPAVLATMQPLQAQAAVTPVPPTATARPLPPTATATPNFTSCTATLGGVYNRGIGSATVTATQTSSICPGTTGYRQTISGSLKNALANTVYDVSAQENGAPGGTRQAFGTFTTDASGNASFSLSVTVPVAARDLGIAIGLSGQPGSTQYAGDVVPCAVPC